MFGVGMRWGAAFSRDDEAAGLPVVVIAKMPNAMKPKCDTDV